MPAKKDPKDWSLGGKPLSRRERRHRLMLELDKARKTAAMRSVIIQHLERELEVTRTQLREYLKAMHAD